MGERAHEAHPRGGGVGPPRRRLAAAGRDLRTTPAALAPRAGSDQRSPMARTAPRRRRDGVVAICRVARWPRVCLVLAGGAAVLLPLVLSIAVVLPPVLLAVPPLALGLGLWLLLRRLDRDEPPRMRPAEGMRRVIPLAHARSRRGATSPTRQQR